MEPQSAEVVYGSSRGGSPLLNSRCGTNCRAAIITGVYAIFAGLWIVYSDRALAALFQDPQDFVKWSVFKGIGFVVVTSTLLFGLMLWLFGTIEKAYNDLVLHERELERFKRLYAVLSQVNQAIVWTKSRDELLNKVCRVIVGGGGFRMVWIGWNDPATHLMKPVAVWGDDAGYLDAIRIYTDDRPEGHGPSGTAFRSGRSAVFNDMLESAALGPWRDAIRKQGFRACGAFPIRENDEVKGILNVYSDETDFFQDKEVALLEEAARDISFALDNLAREQERITAEGMATTERRFSETMIESMPGILYFYDADGTFLRWSRNFEMVSGYAGEEIAKMHPLDFFRSEDKAALQARIAEVFEKGESSLEAPFLLKDGGTIPYFFTGRRVAFEGKECLVGVGIDITERKKAEEAYRELNESLELKVAERTEELGAALVRAEAADRIKSAFLATMSHELRTPLNSIIGFIGIVLQELAGPLNEEQAKQLRMVQGSSRHLLELINDVLDLSKIEAGQLDMKREPFDVPASLERVVASVRPLADKKGLELCAEIPPGLGQIVGDRRRLEQILLNLLNNAIKFTATGRVTLRMETMENYKISEVRASHRALCFSVSDTGIGIKLEDMRALFQPFHQIDSGIARQHEGTGLGLAICRKLAELMDGEMAVQSEWLKGSTFCLTIPQ